MSSQQIAPVTPLPEQRFTSQQDDSGNGMDNCIPSEHPLAKVEDVECDNVCSFYTADSKINSMERSRGETLKFFKPENTPHTEDCTLSLELDSDYGSDDDSDFDSDVDSDDDTAEMHESEPVIDSELSMLQADMNDMSRQLKLSNLLDF